MCNCGTSKMRSAYHRVFNLKKKGCFIDIRFEARTNNILPLGHFLRGNLRPSCWKVLAPTFLYLCFSNQSLPKFNFCNDRSIL